MDHTDETARIEAVLETRERGSRSKDLTLMMSAYAPDVVYFDVVPPLHFTGTDAVRANFQRWFDEYDGDIALETHAQRLVVGDGVAVAHMLHRDTGAVDARDGGDAAGHRELWLRSTVVLERRETGWLIAHEHISLPVDLATMTAAPSARADPAG